MIKQLLALLFYTFIAIITLGLAIVLFSIGLVALWYLLLFAIIFWIIRHLYYLIKGQKPPSINEQYTYYQSRYSKPEPSKKPGRVIDYDEFKDK